MLDLRILGRSSVIRAHLSRCGAGLVEDQPLHVEGQVGERDLGFGAADADGADEQAHDRLLVSEDVLDAGTDLGLGGIGLTPETIKKRISRS